MSVADSIDERIQIIQVIEWVRDLADLFGEMDDLF
jgi:hypothetical protein